MGTILYLVGLVCAVLAVLDIFKKNISTVGKVIASVLVLLTSWVGLLVLLFLREGSSRRVVQVGGSTENGNGGASHRPVSLGSATLLDFRERRCGAGREVVGRIVRVDQLAVGCDLAAYAQTVARLVGARLAGIGVTGVELCIPRIRQILGRNTQIDGVDDPRIGYLEAVLEGHVVVLSVGRMEDVAARESVIGEEPVSGHSDGRDSQCKSVYPQRRA